MSPQFCGPPFSCNICYLSVQIKFEYGKVSHQTKPMTHKLIFRYNYIFHTDIRITELKFWCLLKLMIRKLERFIKTYISKKNSQMQYYIRYLIYPCRNIISSSCLYYMVIQSKLELLKTVLIPYPQKLLLEQYFIYL